jgi:ribonuclease/clavin/mitogillin
MNENTPIKAQAVAAVLWYKNVQKNTEEILMTKRHSWMRIFPGYHAFPGGKIDPGESALETLKREIQEEVGMDLDVENARFHGVATTPRSHPYRYQTHYYSIELTSEQKQAVDSNLKNWQDHPEFASFAWGSAQYFLEQFRKGDQLMVPLVRFFLKEIFHKGVDNAVMVDADNEVLEKIYFPLEMQSEIMQLFIPSKTLPPQKFTNCILFNAETEKLGHEWQSVLMLDPSPIDQKEWENMIRILEQLKIRPEKILCTHHHIDHCSYLHLTAKHFQVPIVMHKRTFELGCEKNPEIWNDILPFIQWVQHEEIIGEWKKQKLQIFYVPGHAAGQIAVTTESREFFIAGDLFQSEGSVVIGGRGSSMKEYMESLDALMKFNPKVLYPSHGIPLGSLSPIAKILKHRLQRHEEVDNLRAKNFSVDEITAKLYSEIPTELMEYAKANVESHLSWLKLESFEQSKQRFAKYL